MRARRIRLVSLLAITVTAVVAAVPNRAGADGSAAQGGPPPLPPVESVTDLGNVGQNALVAGRDGIFSAPWGNKTVWIFNDTVLRAPGYNDDNWANNTLAWTSDLDASNGLTLDQDYLDPTGVPTEFVPHTRGEKRYNRQHEDEAEFAIWPGPVVADPARNRILFSFGEIHRVFGEPGWSEVGSGFAVGTPGGGVTRPIQNPGSPTPTLMWGRGELAFNNSMLVVGDTLYAYGCVHGFLVVQCRVGRVPLADALMKSAWEFYLGGDTWSPDPDQAVPVFNGGAAGSTVLYSPYLGSYLAIYSGIFNDKVMYRVGSNPWGPWSEEAVLFTTRPTPEGTVPYAAEAHYELAQDNGRIQYVTYYRPTPDGFLTADIPLVKVVFGPPAA
jgi:hypothetical protein